MERPVQLLERNGLDEDVNSDVLGTSAASTSMIGSSRRTEDRDRAQEHEKTGRPFHTRTNHPNVALPRSTLD
jgi:hypothetical protein